MKNEIIINLRFSLSNGQFLCRTCLKVEPIFYNEILLNIRLKIFISDIDEEINYNALSLIRHSYNIECSSENQEYGNLFIDDFYIPESTRGYGLSRYLWHIIIKTTSKYLQKIIVSGNLTSVDCKDRDNANYRDNLWKDLIGYNKNHHTIFNPQENNKDGKFMGIMHDPWNPLKNSILQIELL